MKLLLLSGFIICLAASLDGAERSLPKPVVLYSRHFNAQGEERYLPDGTYKDVLEKMQAEFEVRVNSEPLTEKALRGVSVLLIANPSEKAVGSNPPPQHFSAASRLVISNYVRGGGGLFLMGNQENHNLEVEQTNELLRQFGMQFTNIYSDAKALTIPKTTPIIGGLRWGFYTGNAIQLTPGSEGMSRGLVMNDIRVKPVAGKRDFPGLLLAISEPGRGRVVVATDAGFISNAALRHEAIGPVKIEEHDNWEIFRRLLHWAARR